VQATKVRSPQHLARSSDAGNAEALVFYPFDVLHLDGETISATPLQERKERLCEMFAGDPALAIQRLPDPARTDLL
jgi:ATP-dependent DNA ligase